MTIETVFYFILGKRSHDICMHLYACCIAYEEDFDKVQHDKLMGFLKNKACQTKQQANTRDIIV